MRLFEDAGASGKSLSGRPGLLEALESVEHGEASALVVSKLDRLSRSLLDFASLMDSDINNHGQVVGVSHSEKGEPHRAFLWRDGETSELGALYAEWSVTNGINDLGQVVGASPPGPIPGGTWMCHTHAVLWKFPRVASAFASLARWQAFPDAI